MQSDGSSGPLISYIKKNVALDNAKVGGGRGVVGPIAICKHYSPANI